MRLNNHDNSSRDYVRATELRTNASPYEKKLWVALREPMKLKDLKFRRQQAVHPYIADFACMEARLLIELDGASHDTRQEYDKVRDKSLKQMGFTIMRFTNHDVAKNLEGVVMAIMNQAETLLEKSKRDVQLSSPLPNPPREGEGILPPRVEKAKTNA